MPDWLETSRKSLADAVGAPASEYDLGPAEIERLLELARVAAHDSGDRTNAPLVVTSSGSPAAGTRSGRSTSSLPLSAAPRTDPPDQF